MNSASRIRIRSKYSASNVVTYYHGDCMELLRGMPDASAKLVFTSPPYNIGKPYELRLALDDYLLQQRAVIRECVRILRPGGSICWQVGHYVDARRGILPLDILLFPLFTEHDCLHLRNRVIWHFGHGLHTRHRFSGRHESVLWFTKGARYHFDLDSVRIPQKYPGKKSHRGPRRGQFSCHPMGKNPGDVWIFPNVKNNHVEKTAHPCQFPIELPERFILALTRRNDLVLDPYFGVATTAIAAMKHGRRAAGAEIVGEYVRIGRKRLRDAAIGTLRYRPLGRSVFVPTPGTSITTSPFGRVSRSVSP